MSGKRFRARAKTVQKLGRDGLVEQNMATGEEKRVSQRTADISFGPARPQEQAAGHRAAQRGGGDSASSSKKRRKQPRPIQQTAEEAVYSAQEPASVPEAPVSEVSSMRMAADAPMMAAPIASEDPPPPPRRRRKRKNRKKSKQRQAAKLTPDAARSLDGQPAPMRSAGDAPMQNRPPGPTPSKRPPCPVEGGGRLQFKDAEGEQPPSDGKIPVDGRAKMKKQQVMDHAANTAQPEDSQQAEPSADGEGDTRQRDSPPAEGPSPARDDRGAYKKRQAAKFAAHSAAGKTDRPRLQFEDPPPAADSAPPPRAEGGRPAAQSEVSKGGAPGGKGGAEGEAGP